MKVPSYIHRSFAKQILLKKTLISAQVTVEPKAKMSTPSESLPPAIINNKVIKPGLRFNSKVKMLWTF